MTKGPVDHTEPNLVFPSLLCNTLLRPTEAMVVAMQSESAGALRGSSL